MTEEIWGDEFISTYLSIADEASIMNREIHVTSMLTLIGQAMRNVRLNMKNQELDCRVHCMAIQRSGSGKDPAFNFMNKVAEKASFRCSKISSITSAALIGTVEKVGAVKYGAAHSSDIISFKEASSIFYMSGNDHSKDLINNINMCIDVGGHIRKELAHQQAPIEYDTHISLFGTTFPPVTKNIYIDSGLLPRMLLTYKHINSEFYFKVVDWMFSNIGIGVSESYGSIGDLGHTLSIILRETSNGFEFNFNDQRAAYSSIATTIKSIMSKYPVTMQERAEPFISRMAAYALKLSCCYAALDNLTPTIKSEHVGKANAVIGMSLTSILDFVSQHDIANSSEDMKKINMLKAIFQSMKIKGQTQITNSDLFKVMYPNVSSVRELNKHVETLEAMSEIRTEMVVFEDKVEKVVKIL